MNYQKVKKKKQPFKITLKRIQYLGINFTKEVKDLYTESYRTLMMQINGKISHALGLQGYCLNGHTTQSSLQIECNPYQNTHDIFHRARTNNPKIHIELQNTLYCQRKLEIEQGWRYHPPGRSKQHGTGTKTDT